jgi:hypothetical protein
MAAAPDWYQVPLFMKNSWNDIQNFVTNVKNMEFNIQSMLDQNRMPQKVPDGVGNPFFILRRRNNVNEK